MVETPRICRDLGCVVWLTGLPASGKTTVATTLADKLTAAEYPAFVLDGDRLREGLNSDLGFSPADRAENVRRAAEVAVLMARAGLIAIVALISPSRAARAGARAAAGAIPFFEIYVDTPLAECERRDPKGLYRRARDGEIRDFTGISAAYETPEAPDLVVDTRETVPDDVAEQLYDFLRSRGVLERPSASRAACR